MVNYDNNTQIFGFVSNIQLISSSQNFFFLITNANGSVFYKPTGVWRKTFSFVYTYQKTRLFSHLFKTPYALRLANILLLQPISNLEINRLNGSQYVRAAGCFAKALTKNQNTHTVLVKLPSGVRKVFSLYSVAVQGAVALKEKKKIFNTKSGF